MPRFLRNHLSDRLKGAIALALLLFAVLVISGRPETPPASAEMAPGGAVGPYHTLDAL